MAEEQKEKKKKETVVIRDRSAYDHGVLRIKAVPADGFRRAGIWFSHKEMVTIPAGTLNEERYTAIANEPLLLVIEEKAAKK